ncbi:MAG: radical SAM protein [Pirellulales bacterium]|nr:radical SAM protein [Pirellulales bacterium]
MRNTKRQEHRGRIHLNSFYPPYPSAAFDRLCDHVAGRRRAPISAYVALTPRCPCRCGHCSYGHREPRQMTAEQLADAIRQIRELGACIVGFTGGEPLLRKDLADLIALVSADTTTLLFTTGIGLSPERAQELADAGLTCAVIGLESADAAEHDRVRGVEGCFEHARRAVAACRAAGIFPALSTIAFADRIASGAMERIYELARAWGVGEIRIPCPVATGGIAGTTGAMLQPDEKRKMFDFHVQHNRRKDGGPTVTSFAYVESAEMFGCEGGYHHLFIDAAGEVCPCDVTPLSFGNVTRRPLAEIWASMAATFPRPRCECLMSRVGHKILPGEPLPVPPERSRVLLAPPAADEPLPAGFRGLLDPPQRIGRAA